MRKAKWFPIFYMFVVTAGFSFFIIGFAQFTSAKVQANEQFAFERAVLSVLPGLYDEKAGNIELHRRFMEHVKEPTEDTAGAYTYIKDGKLVAYALAFEGKGFWATIKGIIGIEPDKKTVTGIYFYEQKETPGLGAQITTEEFREQFKGKVLSETDKPIKIKRQGETLSESDVYAVTGATQTSTRLEKLLNENIKKWQSQIN